MRWSRNVGRFFGIDVDVHLSFLLLLAWVGIGALVDGGSLLAAALSVLFLVGVFASVVLHELGHALTARAFGIRTRRILLLPIGGMAQLERMPRSPVVELVVALAGPAVSFALGGVLMLATGVLGAASAGALPLVRMFFDSLAYANLVLGGFNLLPAFPMDGGRALRAFLARRRPYLQATELAVRVGKVVAVVLALVGIWTNPWLVAIAAFVWIAASAELRAIRIQAAAEAAARRMFALLQSPHGPVYVDPFWGPVPPDATIYDTTARPRPPPDLP